MKICYIALAEPVPWTRGSSTHIFELSRNLVKLGNEVHVITRYPPNQIDKLSSTQLIDGVIIHRIPTLRKRTLFLITRPILALTLASSIIVKYNIDIIYERYSIPGGVGAILKTLTKKPLILEVNAPEIESYVETGLICKGSLLEKSLLKWRKIQFNLADKIITTSNQIISNTLFKSKVSILPYGANIELFNPNMDSKVMREKYNLGKSPVIIFTGTFHIWHGLQDLIKAVPLVLRSFPNSKFLIVGDGPQFNQISKLTKSLNISQSVILTGGLPYSDIPHLLAAADIAVAPYNDAYYPILKKFGFWWSPLKLFEYMAAAKPIVTTRLGNIEQIILHGKTGLLVHPGNIDELSKAIITLLSNRELRTKLGREARNVAQEKYSWNSHAKRIVSFCKDLQNSRFRRSKRYTE